MKQTVHVTCEVFSEISPDRREMKAFVVELDGEATVLNVLERLYSHHGADVAFFSFCRQGLCGGCLVKVNGKRVMACKTPAEDRMEIRPVAEQG